MRPTYGCRWHWGGFIPRIMPHDLAVRAIRPHARLWQGHQRPRGLPHPHNLRTCARRVNNARATALTPKEIA